MNFAHGGARTAVNSSRTAIPDFNLLLRTSALENVETLLIYAGVGKNERHERAHEVLERMGLEGHLQHLPNHLSGGQQQRVVIALASVSRPSLLLADEPTGNVDMATSNEIACDRGCRVTPRNPIWHLHGNRGRSS